MKCRANSQGKHDIVVSYRRKTSYGLGLLVFRELHDRGYSVFIDVHKHAPGAFPVILQDAIVNCQRFVVVLCSGCFADHHGRDWFVEEIKLALHQLPSKHVLVVQDRYFEEGCKAGTDSFPSDIAHLSEQETVTVDAASWEDKAEHIVEMMMQPGELPREPTQVERLEERLAVASGRTDWLSRAQTRQKWWMLTLLIVVCLTAATSYYHLGRSESPSPPVPLLERPEVHSPPLEGRHAEVPAKPETVSAAEETRSPADDMPRPKEIARYVPIPFGACVQKGGGVEERAGATGEFWGFTFPEGSSPFARFRLPHRVVAAARQYVLECRNVGEQDVKVKVQIDETLLTAVEDGCKEEGGYVRARDGRIVLEVGGELAGRSEHTLVLSFRGGPAANVELGLSKVETVER